VTLIVIVTVTVTVIVTVLEVIVIILVVMVVVVVVLIVVVLDVTGALPASFAVLISPPLSVAHAARFAQNVLKYSPIVVPSVLRTFAVTICTNHAVTTAGTAAVTGKKVEQEGRIREDKGNNKEHVKQVRNKSNDRSSN